MDKKEKTQEKSDTVEKPLEPTGVLSFAASKCCRCKNNCGECKALLDAVREKYARKKCS